MSILPEPQPTLIRGLLEAASRDLATFTTNPEDPNRRAAGQAALSAITSALRFLETARLQLMGDLYGRPVEPPSAALDRVAGNSGPGFPLPKA
jgi:hypothetical protein